MNETTDKGRKLTPKEYINNTKSWVNIEADFYQACNEDLVLKDTKGVRGLSPFLVLDFFKERCNQAPVREVSDFTINNMISFFRENNPGVTEDTLEGYGIGLHKMRSLLSGERKDGDND